MEIHRQIHRGDRWYVLQDHARGTFHRFSSATYLLVSLMDGKRTLQEIWERAAGKLGDDAPTQEQVLQLLAQLNGADVLHADVPPDLAGMAERSANAQRRSLLQKVRNPLAIRLPLIDPDRFLTAALPYIRPLLGWGGLTAWVILVLTGAVLAGVNFEEISKDVSDRILAAQNLVLIAVIYPFVKAIHELGHGFMVKRFGGAVHEMGILMLVFMPVPYVDASDSSAFREKRRRALVGAAGIMVELAIASIALMIWLTVEPGLVKAGAYNTMFIAGVSTLLFNGNPLLRFDGYYVFCDLIEIPNLGNRAARYVQYLFQRYVLGVKDLPPPTMARGETPWLAVYGVASFFYRLSVMTGIVLFVASKFFFIGTLLAVWAFYTMFVQRGWQAARFLAKSPRLSAVRGRALATAGGLVAAIVIFLLAVPVPYSTVAEGVIWTPDQARVLARADGFVASLAATPNTRVAKGAPLIVMSDPLSQARIKVLEAKLNEDELRYAAAEVSDQIQARLVAEQVRHTRERLRIERQKAADLVLRSPAAGIFVLPRPADLKGRFMHKSDLIGYLVEPSHPIVRAVVSQKDIHLVRDRTQSVSVRLVSKPDEVVPATILREVPTATDRLPHGALSVAGGGEISVRQDPKGGPKTLQRYFQFDIGLPRGVPLSDAIGLRVHVRFRLENEPIAWRAYRAFRQMLLRRFDV